MYVRQLGTVLRACLGGGARLHMIARHIDGFGVVGEREGGSPGMVLMCREVLYGVEPEVQYMQYILYKRG